MAKNDMSFTMDPKDLQRCNKILSKLGDIQKEGIIDQGLKEGARIIAEQGKSNIQAQHHYRTGKLYKSVSVLSKKKTGKAYAGFRRGTGYGGAVAHLVDRGTVKRKTLRPYTDKLGRKYRAGINRGKVTGSHFWDDAVQQKSTEAMNTVYESIQKSINRIINRN